MYVERRRRLTSLVYLNGIATVIAVRSFFLKG